METSPDAPDATPVETARADAPLIEPTVAAAAENPLKRTADDAAAADAAAGPSEAAAAEKAGPAVDCSLRELARKGFLTERPSVPQPDFWATHASSSSRYLVHILY